MNAALIGGCGIYCGACDHYLAHQADGKHLLNRDGVTSHKLLEHPCEGCKSEDIDRICVYCRNCIIRLCTIEKKTITCAQCKQFPCEKILDFKSNVMEHKKEAYRELETAPCVSVADWYNHLSNRWACKECKKPHAYYETICANCGKDLACLHPDNRGS